MVPHLFGDVHGHVEDVAGGLDGAGQGELERRVELADQVLALVVTRSSPAAYLSYNP